MRAQIYVFFSRASGHSYRLPGDVGRRRLAVGEPLKGGVSVLLSHLHVLHLPHLALVLVGPDDVVEAVVVLVLGAAAVVMLATVSVVRSHHVHHGVGGGGGRAAGGRGDARAAVVAAASGGSGAAEGVRRLRLVGALAAPAGGGEGWKKLWAIHDGGDGGEGGSVVGSWALGQDHGMERL